MNEFSRIITPPDLDHSSDRKKILILDLNKNDMQNLVQFIAEAECLLDVYIGNSQIDEFWLKSAADLVDNAYGNAVLSYSISVIPFTTFKELTQKIYENISEPNS